MPRKEYFPALRRNPRRERQIETIGECIGADGEFAAVIDYVLGKEVNEMKHSTDRVAKIEPQDGVGKSYDELAAMASKSYWVVPINTDNTAFTKYFQVLDRAQDGKVHYGRG